jgi:hypothetical protein
MYTPQTFVAGEAPTTAKWNLLWSNDADFDTRLQGVEPATYVASGGIPTAAPGSGFVVTIPASTYVFNRTLISVAATTVTLVASSNNFIDVDSTGTYYVTSTTTTADYPAMTAGRQRLFIWQTLAAGPPSLAAITDMRLTKTAQSWQETKLTAAQNISSVTYTDKHTFNLYNVPPGADVKFLFVAGLKPNVAGSNCSVNIIEKISGNNVNLSGRAMSMHSSEDADWVINRTAQRWATAIYPKHPGGTLTVATSAAIEVAGQNIIIGPNTSDTRWAVKMFAWV